MSKQIRLRVFIDFSIEDKKIIEEFLKYFNPIERKFELDITTANDVKAGSLIQESIKQYIEEADIVFAMLSPDYFSNGYDLRLKKYLSILEEKVCPILVRPCSWENTIFKNYQILPIEKIPISLYQNIDTAFSIVSKEIIIILNSKREQKGLGSVNQPTLIKKEDININNLKPHYLYYPVLKEYEQDTKRLFVFNFSFTESFIKKILNIDFWKWVVKTSLIKENENDTYSLVLDTSSKLVETFALNKWELMELAQECINKYKEGFAATQDVVNILKILINYRKKLQYTSIENELIDIFNAFPLKKFPQLFKIFPLIDDISTLLRSFSTPDVEKSKAYLQLTHAYTRLEKLDIAKEYGKLSLEMNKKHLGEQDINTAHSYEALGNVYLYIGDNMKSTLCYKKELAIKENLLDSYDLDMARLYMRMANPYIYTQDYETAIQLLEKSLKICDFQVDKKEANSLLSTIYGNMSYLFGEKGNYNLAIKYGTEAQLLRENIFGIKHPVTGDIYEMLGSIYYHQGEFDKSLFFYKKVHQIRIVSLGEKHSHTIDAKHSIATCYKGLKEHDRALELYHEVIDNTEMNNKNLPLYLDEAGKLHTQLKEYEIALEYLNEALAAKRLLYKEDSPNIAYSMDDIGYVHQLRGNLDAAMERYEEALAIKKTNKMESHPHASTTLQKMGEVFLLKQQYDKALEYFGKALHIRTEKLDETHIDTAKSYYCIAKTYRLKKDYINAVSAEKQALKIFQKRRDEGKILLCYIYYIHNAVKAKIYEQEDFIQLLSDFFFFLNRCSKPNSNIRSKPINIFKKEKTFSEEIAAKILQKLQNKKDFRVLMQKLGISTFIEVQHTLDDIDDVGDDTPTEEKPKKELEAMIKRLQARRGKNKNAE